MTTTQQGPWTVGRLLTWTREHLATRGVDQPRLSAELLLAHALSCRKIELYTRFELVPSEGQLATFREHVKQAAAHAPISYLIGQKEFFSLDFIVTPDVLIPRPETETVVECALSFARTLSYSNPTFFDMGTGSGAIAVSVAKFSPLSRVVASDICESALSVANRNIARHGLQDRIATVQADGPSLPSHLVPDGGFDAVLSNPPYIAESVLNDLPANVRDYEPRIALTAGDGLVHYRRLAAESAALLRPAGRCYVEIGLGQTAPVSALFTTSGWKPIGVWQDLAGLDRVLGFERAA